MFHWRKKQKVTIEAVKGPAFACMHTGICSKGLCPLWVSLDSTVQIGSEKKVISEAGCSLAWTPRLLIELRNQIGETIRKVD